MIRAKEMPTMGLVCAEDQALKECRLEGPYQIEEGKSEVALCKEGEEVHQDGQTERNGRSV